MTDRRVTLAVFPLMVRLFGLGFAGIGMIFVAMMLFGLGKVTVNDEARPATPADAWIPGIFVVIGLSLAAIRYGKEIDGETRVLRTTMGWGWWVRRSEIPLKAEAIEVGEAQERGSGSGRYTAIPVRAVSAGVAQEIAEARTWVAARQLAQRIATALDLPLGPQPAATTTSAAAGMARDTLPAVLPAHLVPPAGTRVRVVPGVRGMEITWAGPGTVKLVLMAVLPTLFFAPFWWFLWRPGLVKPAQKDPALWWFMMAPILMGVFAGVVNTATGWRGGRFGGRVLVDPDRGLVAGGRSVRAADVRDIAAMPALGEGGLMVVLDGSEFPIARGVRGADQVYLRALILSRLAADRREP
jgi:hypothetical protein